MVHHRRQSGFSLLETMLVIVLMGLLSMVGVSHYRERHRQHLIARTGLQIQQHLQAAMAYYVDRNHWPTLINDSDFLPYLPATGHDHNPWGGAYQLHHPNRIRLAVRTTLPDIGLARQVAAALPNATVQSIPNGSAAMVTAEITVPGQVSVANSGWQVVAAGQFQGLEDGQHQSVTDLRCDGSLSIWPSIVAFHPRIENLMGGDPIARLAVASQCAASSCTLTVTNQEEINLHHPEANGTVDVKYLVLCRHHNTIT